MINLAQILSFVIPVRIDSQERLRNITAVASWLEQTQCAIYILEADATQQIPPPVFCGSVKSVMK